MYSEKELMLLCENKKEMKEKFYKANNEKHGTGIGLAVVDERNGRSHM